MLLKRKPGEGDGVRDEAGQPLGKSDRQAEAQCQTAQRPPAGGGTELQTVLQDQVITHL